MEHFLIISPVIVAILIFVYMRNVQAKRKDKLRKRLLKREKNLMLNISSKNEETKNNENG